MKKEKLIYDILILEGALTTKNLNANKFYPADLTKLVKNGFLIRTKRGTYSLGNFDNFIEYGQELLIVGENEKAKKCFDICMENELAAKKVIFMNILLSIKNKQYNEVFNLIDKLDSYDNNSFNADTNLYLFLMSMLTEIPEKNKEFVKYIKFEDAKLYNDDLRFSNIKIQNDIRKTIFTQKFTLAITMIRKELENDQNNLYLNILKELIEQVLIVMNKDRETILDLIKQKNYKELISFLTKKSERQNLGTSDRIALELSSIYDKISEEKIIPVPTVIRKATCIEQAIAFNDFSQALTLAEEYIKKNKMDSRTNPMYLILKDIINIINKIKNGEDIQVVHTIVSKSPSHATTLESKKVVSEIIDKNYFENFVYSLLTNDIDNAIANLKNYMLEKGKSEYESFVLNLIKLDLIDSNLTFKDSILNILSVIKGTFNYDIVSYVNNFYEKVANKEYEKAKIYLEMINKAELFGKSCAFVEILEKLLHSLDKSYSIHTKKEKAKPTYDSSKVYGIKNLDKIVEMMREGMSLEEASSQYNITSEQVTIIKLIFAREYFINGDYEKGTKYLEMVKSEKDKSSIVKSMYEEINRQRKFYATSTPESEKGLILLP